MRIETQIHRRLVMVQTIRRILFCLIGNRKHVMSLRIVRSPTSRASLATRMASSSSSIHQMRQGDVAHRDRLSRFLL